MTAELPDVRPPWVHAVIGATSTPPQYGVLGRSYSSAVGLDLDGCDTLSILGVQGGGKSYTVGAILEMATMPIPRISQLEKPRAAVVFHYHQSDAYEPEILRAVSANTNPGEVASLFNDYGGAKPQALGDVLLLVPEAKLELRRRQYPGITVAPIKFPSAELRGAGWKVLMGAYGNDALYVRQLNAILAEHRETLTIGKLRQSVREAFEAEELSEQGHALAMMRIKLAAGYVDDAAQSIGDHLRAGRVVVVDLRDAWVEQTQAFELFAVLMGIFSAMGQGGEGALFDEARSFPKLFVLDEAHKYMQQPELVRNVVEMVREMRHQGTTVIVASQDPISVPVVVLELSSIVILHRQTSPRWLEHERRAVVALRGLDEKTLSNLAPGEAMIWAQRATDRRFTVAPQKMRIRPRCSAHGGETKTATRRKL